MLCFDVFRLIWFPGSGYLIGEERFEAWSVRVCRIPRRITTPIAANRPRRKQLLSFDIKLPRRSLMVQFTCDSCGERTKRLINRVAYKKGTVFLQCAGCLVCHKFVDNLGLVVEYDLRDEHDVDSDGTD